MRKQYRLEMSAFTESQSFLVQNEARLAEVNATGARRALDEAVERLAAGGTEQDALVRVSKGARARHLAARESLLKHHMKAVAGAARLLAAKAPEMAALSAPKKRVGTAQLLEAAEGMVKVAAMHAEALASVLGPSLLEDLCAVMAEARRAESGGIAVVPGVTQEVKATA